MAFVRSGQPDLALKNRWNCISSAHHAFTFVPPQTRGFPFMLSPTIFRLCDDGHAAKLTGRSGSMAHNLMTSLIFALGAVGSFGIL